MVISPLKLVRRAEEACSLGEGHFREFKSGLHGSPGAKSGRFAKHVCKDIAETLVAFGNADGGVLLVGVEDTGEITGLPHDPEDIEMMMQAPASHVLPQTALSGVQVSRLEIDGRTVLYFSIDQSLEQVYQTSDGRCLVRRDRESTVVAADSLVRDRAEQLSRAYDRAFVDGASLVDLDLELIERVAHQISPNMSADAALQFWDLAEYVDGGLRLRRAALLLFANDVQSWHPRCSVRTLRVPGTELKSGTGYHVTSDVPIVGNIQQLITQSWESLRPHLTRTELASEGLFAEQLIYPELACREALTNAIAHRDYSIEGREIEVFVYDDRMEVRSPGELLSTISIEGLTAGTGNHESRNTRITRVLRELGWMREMGEGIRRILNLMEQNDLQPPALASENGSFAITLHHKSAFSHEDQMWLKAFEDFELTRNEQRVVLLGRDGRLIAPQDIWDSLNLVDTEVYRSIVRGLQVKQILQTTVSKQRAASQARRRKVSVREIGRFSIRDPRDCIGDLNELDNAVRAIGPASILDSSYLQRLRRALGPDNAYRTPNSSASELFRGLGLGDEQNKPTVRTIDLWNQARNRAGAVPRPKDDARFLTKSRSMARQPASSKSTDVGLVGIGREPAQLEVYVGNLPYETFESELDELFQQFGTIQKVTIPVDPFSRRSRGYGFVQFAETSAMQGALDSELVIGGRQLYVKSAHGKRSNTGR